MRTRFSSIRAAALAAVATLLLSACGEVAELFTITLDGDDIAPVEIERSYDFGSVDRSLPCPSGTFMIPDGTGETREVRVMDTAAGCEVLLPDIEVVVFDEAETRMLSDRLDGLEVDGVRSASVQITELVFADGTGAPIPVPGAVSDLEVRTDGETLLTGAQLDEARAGTLERELPQPTVDRIKTAVAEEREARATVTLKVVVASVEDLPAAVDLRVVLQPIVEVNVIDAAI